MSSRCYYIAQILYQAKSTFNIYSQTLFLKDVKPFANTKKKSIQHLCIQNGVVRYESKSIEAIWCQHKNWKMFSITQTKPCDKHLPSEQTFHQYIKRNTYTSSGREACLWKMVLVSLPPLSIGVSSKEVRIWSSGGNFFPSCGSQNVMAEN